MAKDAIAAKVWEHLGMTLPEFTVAWHAGWFEADPRPDVVAMDALMRDGTWDLPASGQPDSGPRIGLRALPGHARIEVQQMPDGRHNWVCACGISSPLGFASPAAANADAWRHKGPTDGRTTHPGSARTARR